MSRLFFISAMCCLLGGIALGTLRSGAGPDATAGTERYPEHVYTSVLSRPVDSLCLIKHRRELLVFNGDSLLKVYWVALGDTPVGAKHFEGDERTPEGLYRIEDRNPNSSCHKNLGISYPNAADRRFAQAARRSPGGAIKIHGLPNGEGYIGREHLLSDWTNGCIGLTDEEVDELYRYVRVGSPILILP